jgi:hypothetical protein
MYIITDFRTLSSVLCLFKTMFWATTLQIYWSEFLPKDSEVPGSIPNATGLI